ncbi:YvfE [Pseudooceanicola batsensis HTCC2597]|uniref:YvfE n=2 Tax=Pseudooceanicola batsensis TaxID=314255 RepID=A3TY37_PSEBH|nr:YvfE [Pseudooceanicola batsensis HTCC2597]
MSGRERVHVGEAFDSNFVAPVGPQLNAFEEHVAEYLGQGLHCVGLSSGSAALHLALRIVGVGAGDEVWISSMTFAGGIFPVLYMGATPVFFDLDPTSWTVDAGLLREELAAAARAGRLPKAIVPTDLYGQSADLDPLEEICAEYGVKLVVDSAESLGGEYRAGRKCGSGGDAAILSFNGNKIITTSSGGMLVTRDAGVADQARFLSTQARDPAPHYEHSTFGYNYRLSNILAGIGIGQMSVLDDRVATRRAIFERYREALEPLGVAFMPEPAGYRSTRWLTAGLFPAAGEGADRETVREELARHEIESRPLWKPMHMQPLFAGTSYKGSGFDEHCFERGLCLPSGSDMSRDEQDEVIGRVAELLKRG